MQNDHNPLTYCSACHRSIHPMALAQYGDQLFCSDCAPPEQRAPYFFFTIYKTYGELYLDTRRVQIWTRVTF